MTLAFFNTLDERDQLNVVVNHGEIIAQRLTEKYQITLSQLFSFYVEVYSSGEKWLCSIRGFDDAENLDIYLESIDISGALGN